MAEHKRPHCWADKKAWAEETYGYLSPEHVEAESQNCTCMLLDGHDGPHEWTPNDEIVVQFPPRDVTEARPLTTTLGPAGFGRPASAAEREAFRRDIETPGARAARLLAFWESRRGLRRRDRDRLRREACREQNG